MKLEYLASRKSVLDLSGKIDERWDLFISAFNDSRRVQSVFSSFPANTKRWVVLPEYGYSSTEISALQAPIVPGIGANEADVILAVAQSVGMDSLCSGRLCVDMTGFMRPHILYLVKYLSDQGIRRFDMVYTEPAHYSRKENTRFSNEQIESVRQVMGYEGMHDDEMAGDVLVIGVGYDHALVSRVANDKDGSRLIQLLSLPSLSADMYQESILRLDRTGSIFNQDMEDRMFFAPANDPFVIAAELSDKFQEIQNRSHVTNTYLCPLATKPQALGFSLFYLRELVDSAASIIFPFARHYDRETSKGVGRTWLYEVNL
ncbi:hypothetical protein [Paraburkholderia saeva]|uniref:hypothetical protein n=1 Tax=Paraburkholderia saeva TaxID=2777537 RepID=UPI001E18E8AD|nr:hypothetical protein [Paraburkholderia saeva]CAG4911200.1 hypothetical protein R70241_03909 [Paraburkholderia saeva]